MPSDEQEVKVGYNGRVRKPWRYSRNKYSRVPKSRLKREGGGYVPPSPSQRDTPWVNISMRSEHYAMLREIAAVYDAPLSKIVGSMVVQQYCNMLRELEPATAQRIIDTYREDERHTGQILDMVIKTWDSDKHE